jgi:hypothetical protein
MMWRKPYYSFGRRYIYSGVFLCHRVAAGYNKHKEDEEESYHNNDEYPCHIPVVVVRIETISTVWRTSNIAAPSDSV